MSSPSDNNGVNRMNKAFITGNQAIAEAVKLARVAVVAAYPITPQTGIVNHLADLIATKKLDAKLVHAESESSALSIALGSTLGGIRSFTATSSQGLLMMAETTYFTSGMRIPLVMAVVNRGLSAPVTIFTDHQDSMTLRDNGWLQFYCKDGQEALDTIITAFHIAEHKDVLLPIKVCIDGFSVSHLSEPISLPSQELVDEFLPEFSPNFPNMTTDDPKFLGTAAWPDYYEEFIFLRTKALTESYKIIQEVCTKYTDVIRPVVSSYSTYKVEDADILLIGIGAMMSTLEVVVDELNKAKGKMYGLVRIKCFRPFPGADLLNLIKSKSKIVVLDRAISPSQGGPLFLEISSLLHTSGQDIDCLGVILGIGGRDINLDLGMRIRKIVDELNPNSTQARQYWIDLNQDTIKRWTSNE